MALAYDIHGGRWFSDPQEMLARCLPLLADPDRMRAIGHAALDVLRVEPRTDPDRIGAVGYGTGGAIGLELGPLRAIGTVNALTTGRPGEAARIRCPVWAGVGSEDPIQPPEQRDAFAAEMQAAGVDWRLTVYGGALRVPPPADRPGRHAAARRHVRPDRAPRRRLPPATRAAGLARRRRPARRVPAREPVGAASGVASGSSRIWVSGAAATIVGMGKHARKLVVALHVVSSVGWMSMAVALLALLGAGGAGPWAAEYLDAHVLTYAANISAFTGILLATATPWGLVRHWWVATKLVLTVVQVNAGIFVLSGALRESAAAAAVGQDGPAGAVAVGAGLMASALAFQTWLSVAKPWGRSPMARAGDRGTTAPTAVFVAGLLAVAVDVAVGLSLGVPLPAASFVVLIFLLARPWARTSVQRPLVSSSRP